MIASSTLAHPTFRIFDAAQNLTRLLALAAASLAVSMLAVTLLFLVIVSFSRYAAWSHLEPLRAARVPAAGAVLEYVRRSRGSLLPHVSGALAFRTSRLTRTTPLASMADRPEPQPRLGGRPITKDRQSRPN